MGRKRRATFKIASDVVAPLETLLRAHPDLGFDSTSQAVTQAIVRFTNELRDQIRHAEGKDMRDNPDVDKVLEFLNRLARQQAASGEADAKMAARKRGRQA